MVVGDSIMPFEVRLSSKATGATIEGYEQIKLPDGSWEYTHRIAGLLCEKQDGDEDTIHHVGNRYVTKIEHIGNGPVYCMTVPDTGNFAISTSPGKRGGVISSNTGSIGWGKDYLATTCLLRVIYELICLKNPQETLGLGKGEPIHIVPISHLKEAAQRVVFEGLSRKLALSPFFKGRYKETNEEIYFPGKGVYIVGGGSNDNSALGLNVWSALVDECVRGDTLISMAGGGLVRIDALVNNASSCTILAYDGEQIVESEAFVKPASFTDVFRVTLNSGRHIEATENHPLLVRRSNGAEEYVWVRDLRPGDEVITVEELSRGDHEVDSGNVLSIVYVGRDQTYDLMSVTHGNFIANGIVVHNTNFMGKVRKGTITASGPNEDKATSVYHALQRRVKSRYAARGLKGMIFLVSSKRSVHDFTERHLRDAMKDNDPGVFVRDYATWDVRPNAFAGQRWWTAAVSQKEGRTRVLGDEEKPKPDEITFSFPDEYHREFLNDPEGATRDIAGLALESFKPFFSNRQAIQDMMDQARPHPFHVYEWNPDREIKILWNQLVVENVHGDPVPMCCPGSPRHAHLDLSKNQDATGLCVGHRAGEVMVRRLDPETHEYKTEEAPVIHIDLVLRIIPPHAGEIDHQLVRSLIYKLVEGGLPIRSVSADKWMGLPNLQLLEKRGFKTEEISTQKTLGPYLAARSAMYERRIKSPVYPFLEKELRELELNEQNTKLDHPKGGTKDVSDSFAAVVFYIATKSRPLGTIVMTKGVSRSERQDVGLPYPTSDGGFRWPDDPPPETSSGGSGEYDGLPSYIL